MCIGRHPGTRTLRTFFGADDGGGVLVLAKLEHRKGCQHSRDGGVVGRPHAHEADLPTQLRLGLLKIACAGHLWPRASGSPSPSPMRRHGRLRLPAVAVHRDRGHI
jgi:hypothetical protein